MLAQRATGAELAGDRGACTRRNLRPLETHCRFVWSNQPFRTALDGALTVRHGRLWQPEPRAEGQNQQGAPNDDPWLASPWSLKPTAKYDIRCPARRMPRLAHGSSCDCETSPARSVSWVAD